MCGINNPNRMNMNNDINNINVENLSKAWKEDLANHYSDKPRLCSILKSNPVTFEIEGDSLKVIFSVNNEVQKLWFEIKMIPEMEELFKSITGIGELSIHPVMDEAHEDTRIYYPSTKRPVLPDEIICVENLVKDLELDIN